MRPGSRLARWKRGGMRIMARRADLPIHRTEVAIPETAGPPMDTRFPIPVSRAMATAAEGRAVDNFQMPAVAGLKQLEIGFVVAIIAVVIAMMTPMSHHDIVM